MPKISVIIPAYNAGKYLNQCLKSIEQQTMRDIEIIVVDDGSTDGTKEILDRHADTDSRIKAILQENGGSVLARKTGIKMASADYITFVDADDWIEPEYLKNQYDVIIKENVDFVHSGYKEDRNGFAHGVYPEWPTGIIDIGRNRSELVKDVILGGGITPSMWSKIIKRNIVEDLYMQQNDGQQMGEDLIFLIKLILQCDRCYINGENIGYHYRISDSSMSHKIDRKYNRSILGLSQEIYRALRAGSSNYDLDYEGISFRFLLDNLRSQYTHESLNKEFYIENVEELFDKKIVLYGNGMVGNGLYRFLSAYDRINIVGWIDEVNFKNDYFSHVDDVKNICKYDFDYIVLGTVRDGIYRSMVENLVRLDVPYSRIFRERVNKRYKIDSI